MARYIDVDLLKKDLKNPDLCNVTDKIISIIDIQPTADVQPVVHGGGKPKCSVSSCFRRKSKCKGYTIAKMDGGEK